MNQAENIVAAPITNKFIDWGLTRDSLVWFWGRLTMASLLFASGLYPLEPYVGEKWAKIIQSAAVVILFLSGKYDSSPLPGKKN